MLWIHLYRCQRPSRSMARAVKIRGDLLESPPETIGGFRSNPPQEIGRYKTRQIVTLSSLNLAEVCGTFNG